MGMSHLTVDELARIAMCGGGFRMDCGSYHIDDLARIAMCASKKKARIIFEGSSVLSVDEMARIALAGDGSASFE